MTRTAKPQRRTVRYWLLQLHLWTGLILMLPLVMMGITGAVLVYAHDLEHLFGQGEPPAVTAGEWRTPSEIIEAAQAANAEPGRIPIAVRWPMEVGEPAAVRLSRPGMATERPPSAAASRTRRRRAALHRPARRVGPCRPRAPSPAACRSSSIRYPCRSSGRSRR